MHETWYNSMGMWQFLVDNSDDDEMRTISIAECSYDQINRLSECQLSSFKSINISFDLPGQHRLFPSQLILTVI